MLAIEYDYMSYEDFLNFSQSGIYNKMEYYNGDIVCMSPTHPVHNKIQNELYFHLRSAIDRNNCEVYTSDVAVKFELVDEKYQFEPDVMVVCDDNFDKSVYVGIPKLVIEVLSKATQHRDLGIKLDVYEKFGVQEYWIVDINNKEIKIYSHNVNGKFKSIITYTVDDEVIFNNYQIILNQVFK